MQFSFRPHSATPIPSQFRESTWTPSFVTEAMVKDNARRRCHIAERQSLS